MKYKEFRKELKKRMQYCKSGSIERKAFCNTIFFINDLKHTVLKYCRDNEMWGELIFCITHADFNEDEGKSNIYISICFDKNYYETIINCIQEGLDTFSVGFKTYYDELLLDTPADTRTFLIINELVTLCKEYYDYYDYEIQRFQKRVIRKA